MKCHNKCRICLPCPQFKVLPPISGQASPVNAKPTYKALQWKSTLHRAMLDLIILKCVIVTTCCWQSSRLHHDHIPPEVCLHKNVETMPTLKYMLHVRLWPPLEFFILSWGSVNNCIGTATHVSKLSFFSGIKKRARFSITISVVIPVHFLKTPICGSCIYWI